MSQETEQRRTNGSREDRRFPHMMIWWPLVPAVVAGILAYAQVAANEESIQSINRMKADITYVDGKIRLHEAQETLINDRQDRRMEAMQEDIQEIKNRQAEIQKRLQETQQVIEELLRRVP